MAEKKITNTSTGEPVTNQAPAPAEATTTPEQPTTPAAPETAPATSPATATATPAAEATATAASETTAPATLDEATHAAHRQRVEELKKSLTSYSSTATPATAITADTPAATPADAPVDASATADAAPSETAAAVEETAPAPANPAPVQVSLPSGYLASGSMVEESGVMLPEYIGEYAEKIAQSLEPLSASSFQRAFLTQAKAVRKKKIPYSEKKNCAQGMIIAAKKLVNRKTDPAPRVLLDMINLATATVEDDATFDVLYMHLDAIYTNLMCD